MKVTVTFGSVKVVVPCGQGNMLIRDLARMAAMRYQKTSARSSDNRSADGAEGKLTLDEDSIRCEVTSLTLARDGGILDSDDKVTDVLDDRELLVAHFRMLGDPTTKESVGGSSSPRLNHTTPYSRCNGEEESESVLKDSVAALSLNSSTTRQSTRENIVPPPPPLRFTKHYPTPRSDCQDRSVVATPSVSSGITSLSGQPVRHNRPAPPPPPLLPACNSTQPVMRTPNDGAQVTDTNENNHTILPRASWSTGPCSTQASSQNGRSVGMRPIPTQFHGHCPLLTDHLIVSDPTMQPFVPMCLTNEIIPTTTMSTAASCDWPPPSTGSDVFPTSTPLPIPPYPPFAFDRLEQSSSTTSSSWDNSTTSTTNPLSTVVEEEDHSAVHTTPSVGLSKCHDANCSDSTSTPTMRASSSPKREQINEHLTQKSYPPKAGTDAPSQYAQTCPRPNRKVKRRRAPRAAPPPPPTISATPTEPVKIPMGLKERQSIPTSTSSDDNDGNVDEGSKTIRRGLQPVDRTADRSRDIQPLYIECDTTPHDRPDVGSASSLDKVHSKGASSDRCTGPSLQPVSELSISPHWKSSTDCLPGYSPKELAEAERSLQTEAGNASKPSNEHRLSIDEERAFTMMKPAPPKRSPLTVLTGLSFLMPGSMQDSHHTHLGGSHRRHTGAGGSDDGDSAADFMDDSGSNHGSADAVAGEPSHSSVSDNQKNSPSSNQDDEEFNQRRLAAAEDEVIHMTELLSKRRESEARRHLMMAEMEADLERDHRLKAAATAMALAAVSSMSPSKMKPRPESNHHKSKCPWHSHSAKGSRLKKDSFGLDNTMQRERELVIKLRKTSCGLGFSLTTKPLPTKNLSSADPVPTGVYVKSILPDGAAIKDGQLQLGDRLITIDKEDITTKTQAQVVSVLRKKPVDTVIELTVRRLIPEPLLLDLNCPNCVRQHPELTCCHDANCPYHSAIFCQDPANGLYHTVSINRHKDKNNTTEKPLTRCASPVIPRRTQKWIDDVPELVTSSDYPCFPDVLLMRLEVSLTNPDASRLNDRVHSADVPLDSTMFKHMRLGVSVREALSSRLARLRNEISGHQSVFNKSGEELWSNVDSIYGGVIVKGVIEGGAAHKDGRLRVGDELLEVNGVPLINTHNPLSVLRSLLKQALHQHSSSRLADLSAPVQQEPMVQLLVARQSRHRRSASGHTLASNSEFMTEGSSTGTAVTATTCLTSVIPRHRQQLGGSLNTSPGISDGLGTGAPEETSSSGHAVQIAADVHSMDEFCQTSMATSPSCKALAEGGDCVIYSVANSHVTTTTSSVSGQTNDRPLGT